MRRDAPEIDPVPTAVTRDVSDLPRARHPLPCRPAAINGPRNAPYWRSCIRGEIPDQPGAFGWFNEAWDLQRLLRSLCACSDGVVDVPERAVVHALLDGLDDALTEA